MSTPAEKARESPWKRIIEMSVRGSISASACCNSSIIGRSMILSGGLIRVIRATGEFTSRLSRAVEAVAIFVGDPCGASLRWTAEGGCPRQAVLNVDGLLPRLANRRKRIARPLFLFDPLLFVADDVEQQFFIFHAGKVLLTVLLVAAVVQRLAGLAVVLLPCPLSDAAVKTNVGRVELLLARLQKRIQPLHQSG